MTRIEWLRGKMDTNGNSVYYYRFIGENGVDYTYEFGFIGRRTTYKKMRVIRTNTQPNELYNIFNGNANIVKFTLPELGKAQKDIDRCNHGNGCAIYCGNSGKYNCFALREHAKYSELRGKIQEIIDTPFEGYKEIRI